MQSTKNKKRKKNYNYNNKNNIYKFTNNSELGRFLRRIRERKRERKDEEAEDDEIRIIKFFINNKIFSLLLHRQF